MKNTEITDELRGRGLMPLGEPGAAASTFYNMASMATLDRSIGALIGTACGDALGRPLERRSPEWIRSRHGVVRDFIERTGRSRTWPAGTISDDTQLTMMSAAAIQDAGDDHPAEFARQLARDVRKIRGMGSGTRRAAERLDAGTPWWRSGSPSSGNGVAMRAAALGVAFGDDPARLRVEVCRNGVVTHDDQLALAAAIAQAYAVARLSRTAKGTLVPADLLEETAAILAGFDNVGGIDRRPAGEGRWVRLLDRIDEVGTMLNASPSEAFALTHNGAYVLESFPAALWAFLSRPEDPEAAIVTAVNGGYDADTVGAMTGALVGAYHGASGLPDRWTSQVEGAGELTKLARHLHPGGAGATRATPSTVRTKADAADADEVHVSILLDRSGSMRGLADETIGGFNAFLDEQRQLQGSCRVTLVQFDAGDPHDVVADAIPVSEMTDLDDATYQPRGLTPLLDALGTLIGRIDRRLAGNADEFQLVAVITDGQENASSEFSRAAIAQLVKDRSDAGWAFVFLGANIDSFTEAGSMGMAHAQAGDWEHTADGVRKGFDAVSRSSRKWRESSGLEAKLALKDQLMDEVRREWKEEE